MLRKWEELPHDMQNDQVRYYYNILYKKRGSLIVKRLFDIICALILLVILLPVFIIIGFAILIDSRGPAFFRQVRVTQYGKWFRMIKFRTMVKDAERLGSQVTIKNDARLTRIGGFLRKYRLDELPQLLNIISGDMSFVGTRPEVCKYVDKYSSEMRATLLLPAGVTSKASIQYKDEQLILSNTEKADEEYVSVILPEKMKLNLRDIASFSFFGDIRIICNTVLAVFHPKAYAEGKNAVET